MLDDLGDLRDVDIEGIDDNLWVKVIQFDFNSKFRWITLSHFPLAEVMKIPIQKQNVT